MAAQRWLSSILEQILQTDCDEYAESLFKKPVNEAANELACLLGPDSPVIPQFSKKYQEASRRAPKSREELPIHIPDSLESIPYFKPQQKSQKKNKQKQKQKRGASRGTVDQLSSQPTVHSEAIAPNQSTFPQSTATDSTLRKTSSPAVSDSKEGQSSPASDETSKEASRVTITAPKKSATAKSRDQPRRNTKQNASTPKSLCGCFGTEHKLLGNCLFCGRIICSKEGYGSCPACGESFIQDKSTGHLANFRIPKEIQNTDGFKEAYDRKVRLIEYDRTSAQRTHVHDDQDDYYGTEWMSPEEVAEREAKREAKREEERKRAEEMANTIVLDFAGRRVLPMEKYQQISKTSHFFDPKESSDDSDDGSDDGGEADVCCCAPEEEERDTVPLVDSTSNADAAFEFADQDKIDSWLEENVKECEKVKYEEESEKIQTDSTGHRADRVQHDYFSFDPFVAPDKDNEDPFLEEQDSSEIHLNVNSSLSTYPFLQLSGIHESIVKKCELTDDEHLSNLNIVKKYGMGTYLIGETVERLEHLDDVFGSSASLVVAAPPNPQESTVKDLMKLKNIKRHCLNLYKSLPNSLVPEDVDKLVAEHLHLLSLFQQNTSLILPPLTKSTLPYHLVFKEHLNNSMSSVAPSRFSKLDTVYLCVKSTSPTLHDVARAWCAEQTVFIASPSDLHRSLLDCKPQSTFRLLPFAGCLCMCAADGLRALRADISAASLTNACAVSGARDSAELCAGASDSLTTAALRREVLSAFFGNVDAADDFASLAEYHPGYVGTSMWEGLRDEIEKNAAFKKELLERLARFSRFVSQFECTQSQKVELARFVREFVTGTKLVAKK